MIEKIKKKVENILWKYGSHDIDHTMRVYNMSMYIGKEEWADLEILEIASLLHDIWRPKQHETKWKVCHAEYGAELTKKILEELGLNSDKIDKIVYCIHTHRFRKEEQLNSLEAKVLFDADKLDSIGAVGIGRAFFYANEGGAKLHNDIDTDVINTKEFSLDDTAYREYLVKLSKVKDKLYTKTAQKLAQKRHKIMEEFFENLIEETRGIEKMI